MAEFDKIYFLHIPKTAGSSFNSAFRSCVPDQRFFEHMESRGALFREVKEQTEPFFISGHLTFAATRDLIARPDVFSISILREPIAQFVSHLKWLKYVGSPTYPHPDRIPPAIMDLARNLHATSLNELQNLESHMESKTGRMLLDNLQVRYLGGVSGEWVTRGDAERACENIQNLDLFFALEDLDAALPRLRRAFPRLGVVGRVNAARVEETVNLTDRLVRDFYSARTEHDRYLYEVARSISRARLAASELQPGRVS